MAQKHKVIEWLPWLPNKSCYINLKFLEILKDTPNTFEGFRFVAFGILVILVVGPVQPQTPPPLVLDLCSKTLGAQRVNMLYVHCFMTFIYIPTQIDQYKM